MTAKNDVKFRFKIDMSNLMNIASSSQNKKFTFWLVP